MKRISFFSIIICLVLNACAPSTFITGSWKSPNNNKQYTRFLIAALTSNTITKAKLEKDMAAALGNNIYTLKSIEEFPPDISGSDSNKINLMNKVKNKNVEAIMTISIIKKETETRYVPGRSPYDPLGYTYYNNFWGYYDYWYPNFYNQGYYEQNQIYFIETNVYDTGTEKLIWSAQSKTYNPEELESFSKDFAATIVKKMTEEKLIPATIKKKDSNPEGY
jgi:hypothetical protein